MKLASYNIMSGGFAEYSHTLTKPERLEKIKSVITGLGAEVIGLIDTFRWDEVFSTEQLKDAFGYQHILRTNLDDARLNADGGESIGLVLMSKVPWKESQVIRLSTRNGLKVTYKLKGKKIELFLVYFDDLSEDVRKKQANALLGYIKDTKNAVVMGDLNTFSPVDIEPVVADIEDFYNSNPGIKDKFEPILTDMRRGEVITLLQANGLQDAGSRAGPTMPSKLFPAYTTGPFLRVDYCLHGLGVMVSDFQVHINPVAQQASDHFPITFVLKQVKKAYTQE